MTTYAPNTLSEADTQNRILDVVLALAPRIADAMGWPPDGIKAATDLRDWRRAIMHNILTIAGDELRLPLETRSVQRVVDRITAYEAKLHEAWCPKTLGDGCLCITCGRVGGAS